MEKHTLKSFDCDLDKIKYELNQLANIVLIEFEQAIDVFEKPNQQLAHGIAKQDIKANQYVVNIEQLSALILTRQNAVADDLRFILASMRIAPKLERVGDYAKSMALKASQFNHAISPDIAHKFHQMHLHLMTMLRNVIEAYNTKNATQANIVWEEDDLLDTYYHDVYAKILQSLKDHTTSPEQLVALLFIAKGLERAGDHISDSAKDVQFMVSGT
ncbi:MAG: phosphate signaling complex protein PhoU [Vibrio sp.]